MAECRGNEGAVETESRKLTLRSNKDRTAHPVGCLVDDFDPDKVTVNTYFPIFQRYSREQNLS